tara:strand:- start:1119 stop:2513 length:1395 start_codon:yes stop_codon:yes gene_type:complete
MLQKILFIFIFFSINTSVFSQDLIRINSIEINGNKKTKDYIILNELAFKVDNRLSIKELEQKITESEENLINLKLFNFVDITSIIDQKNVTIVIDIVERWYVWPYPILEISDRNFNSWWEEFSEENYNDFSRLNYGIFLNIENYRGKNELIKAKIRRGFSEQYLFSYNIPYFKNIKNFGFNADIELKQNKKIHYTTFDNKLVYFNDVNSYVLKKYGFSFGVKYRRSININHNIIFNQFFTNLNDSVVLLNPNYLNNQQNNGNYSKIMYKYINERRDYIAYPLKGYNVTFSLLKFIPGSVPAKHMELAFKIENHINIFDRFYFGSSFKTKINSNEKQPYIEKKYLGFEDYIRGYEYYVIEGDNYWISKTAIKYNILKKRNFTLPYIKMEQFKKSHYSLFTSLFADIGYINDGYENETVNKLANIALASVGLSLDYITYYDKIIRIEYSINKLGEKGVFLHFSNPF